MKVQNRRQEKQLMDRTGHSLWLLLQDLCHFLEAVWVLFPTVTKWKRTRNETESKKRSNHYCWVCRDCATSKHTLRNMTSLSKDFCSRSNSESICAHNTCVLHRRKLGHRMSLGISQTSKEKNPSPLTSSVLLKPSALAPALPSSSPQYSQGFDNLE